MAHVVEHRSGARRSMRVIAGLAAAGLAATAIVATGGGSAGAATPNAQAVGRFLDGSAGGSPIQGLVDLKDARATAPGTTSAQNPLDAKAFNALDIPLTGAVDLPTSPSVDAGVVNQVASAHTDGRSRGAAGAVADDGGVNLGDHGSEPAAATLDLSAASFGSVDVPGFGNAGGVPDAGALGAVTASIHSVYSRVGTAAGGAVQTPSSGVSGLTLMIGSPALKAVVAQLKSAFKTASLAPLAGALSLTGCQLSDPKAADIRLAGGGVVISPTKAAITIDVDALLKTLLDGKDLAHLNTSNFDLVAFLVKKLPKILAGGVGDLITSTTTALATQLTACVPASKSVVSGLLTGQGAVKKAVDAVVAPLASAGASGLDQLVDGLKNVVDIGLNVQSGPGIQRREQTYTYESRLDATPNQATDVVDGQTLVRAVEINVLDVSAVPGAGNAPDGLNVALANSAAGPSHVSAAPRTSAQAAAVDATAVPTGIPAGAASGTASGGVPVLPIAAVLVLLAVCGAAFWQLHGKREPGHR